MADAPGTERSSWIGTGEAPANPIYDHYASALASLEVMAERSGKARKILAHWQKPSHILLAAGEMSAQELRTVRAVVGAIQRDILSALDGN